jgi:Condensation domain
MHELAGTCPCSYQQLDRLRRNEPSVASGLEASCAHPVSDGAFYEAVCELTRRHAALRTSFRVPGVDAGRAVAEIHVHDPSRLFLLSRPSRREFVIASRIATPLHPREHPIWRASLRPAPGGGVRLHFAVDQLVFDSASASIFLEELASLCTEQRGNLPAPGSYADYAYWQRTEYTSTQADRDLAYWTAQLAGEPERPVLLPGFDPHGAVRSSGRQSSRSLLLGEQVWPRLVESSVSAGGTAVTAVAALIVAALAARSTSDDVTIYCPVAARPLQHARTVGWFENLMPLRFAPRDDLSSRDWITAVQTQMLGGTEHWLMPWDLLRARVGADPASPVRPGLVLLTVVDAQTPAAAARLGWRLSHGARTTSQAGLDLRVLIGADDARITCNYPADGYPDDCIDDLIRTIGAVARRLSTAQVAR